MLVPKQESYSPDIKDEPIDSVEATLQHALDWVYQPLKSICIGNGTKVKNEDQSRDLSSSPVPNLEQLPRKRQRVLVDVPTVAEAQRQKGADDDDIEKLKNCSRSPKKEKELALDIKTLVNRLKPIGLDPFEVNLPRAELNQMVSRLFMASTYGGSMQAAFPKIKAAKVARHGMAYFMYLSSEYHPYAPQIPGGAGLWFDPDPEWCEDPLDQIQRVFTKDGVDPKWQYMGQYEIKATTSLTRAEWLELGDTRKFWAGKIRAKEWGKRLCARIQARKEVEPGREPSDEEVAAVLSSRRWEFATAEDIKIAYDSGKERMGVWTMKCIGYDCRFQLELYNNYPNWTAPTTSKVKKKDQRSKKQGKRVKLKLEVKAEDEKVLSANASRGTKRKRPTPDSSEPGTKMWIKDEAKVMEIVDDEEKVLHKIRTRGTKSRPICL